MRQDSCMFKRSLNFTLQKYILLYNKLESMYDLVFTEIKINLLHINWLCLADSSTVNVALFLPLVYCLNTICQCIIFKPHTLFLRSISVLKVWHPVYN